MKYIYFDIWRGRDAASKLCNFREQCDQHFKLTAYIPIVPKVKKDWSYATMKDQAL
jgi:hypothetical protein